MGVGGGVGVSRGRGVSRATHDPQPSVINLSSWGQPSKPPDLYVGGR